MIFAQTSPGSITIDPMKWAIVTALLTTVGTVVASFFKDYLVARHIERFKGKQVFSIQFSKFKNPLILEAIDLAFRINRILFTQENDWLVSEAISKPCLRSEIAGEGQDYDTQYNQISTVYRFMAFYGWLELFRLELAHVHENGYEQVKELRDIIEAMNNALADQKWTANLGWFGQPDSTLFRDELRAIGECMLQSESRSVLGFEGFLVAFNQRDSRVRHWAYEVLNLFLHVRENKQKNCRYKRLLEFFKNLISLIESLDPAHVPERLIPQRTEASSRLRDYIH